MYVPPAPAPPGDLRPAGPTVNASDRPGALATREIIAAAQAVGMPARGTSVVRITSVHSTDDARAIIGFYVDGVAGTESGPQYWGHSGLWPVEMTSIWETWRDYRFELLGRVQDSTAGPTGAPVAVIPWPSSTETIAINLWRQRAFCDRSRAFAEILWRPQDLPHGTGQILPPSGVKARQKKAARRGFPPASPPPDSWTTLGRR